METFPTVCSNQEENEKKSLNEKLLMWCWLWHARWEALSFQDVFFFLLLFNGIETFTSYDNENYSQRTPEYQQKFNANYAFKGLEWPQSPTRVTHYGWRFALFSPLSTARRRAAAKRKKLKNLGKSKSTDTEEEDAEDDCGDDGELDHIADV